jgi:hypothetical protein
MPCPSCNTREWLLQAKAHAEETSSYSSMFSSGTGETIWKHAVLIAEREQPGEAAKVLKEIGVVRALVDDDSSPEGYAERVYTY